MNKVFWEVDRDVIFSIPLLSFRGDEDTPLWHYEEKGFYSVKLGYWLDRNRM